MRTSHELLLRCYHDPSFVFADVLVCYIDRGAPGNESCVSGEEITTLDSQFIGIGRGIEAAHIPYHRIKRILYCGRVLWERAGYSQGTEESN